MKIIGITGTLGAGKGEVVEYFKKKGFAHFSARAFLQEELERRGLETNRDNTTLVANDLRRLHSPSYIIESLFKRAQATGKDCIIESIRTLGEVEFLKKQPDFCLLSVNAERKLRFDRIHSRKSPLDSVNFEKFISDEEREMNQTDPTKGNIVGCIREADFAIMNNGTLEELHQSIDKILPQILK